MAAVTSQKLHLGNFYVRKRTDRHRIGAENPSDFSRPRHVALPADKTRLFLEVLC